MKSVLYIFLFLSFLGIAQTETKVSLYYKNDVYTLEDIHLKKIDSIKQIIAKTDSVLVRIEGYANAYGTDRYNLKLSQKRATTVQTFFDQNTVVAVQGFGELESTAAQNRRVDILISSYVFEKEEVVDNVEDIIKINDLSTLKVGDKIILKGILFVGGSHKILPESKNALQELYKNMNMHKGLRIHLIGHICCHGDMRPSKDGYNFIKKRFSLSNDRAEAIYNYLINRGIPKERITYEGKAYLEPLGKGDKYDRRVEIEIIE